MAGWVCVLCAPLARGLADDEIAAAARLLGAAVDAPRRLTDGSAEIACETRPDLQPIAAALPNIDVNAVPAEGRRKRLLIADMDSTMIPVECIDEVAAHAGVGAEVAEITERAMAGELDFEGALRARMALLAGIAEEALDDVYRTRVGLNPGAECLVRTMAAHGAHTMLVSGGFTYFAERVALAAGFLEYRANRLVFANGRLTGDVADPILGQQAKLDALREACAARGLATEDALALGDGANDLSMIRVAGLGVAFRAKPVLREAADATIRHAGLEGVLAVQGYRQDELIG